MRSIAKRKFARVAAPLLAFASLWTWAGPLAAGEKYEIDPVHSSVVFTVSHMVVSDVKGRFTAFSGTVDVDEADPSKSSVEVAIEVKSINTDNSKRDTHLRSADFFDADKHPTITFKSRKVEKTGKDEYKVTGTFTMKGVSKEISFPIKASGPIKDTRGGTIRGFKGSLKLDRQDYGVSYSKTLEGGGLMVGNEVTIDLAIEAGKKKEGEAPKQ